MLGVTHISNLPTVRLKLMQVGGWVSTLVLRFDTRNNQFLLKPYPAFNFKKKNITLNKGRPENSFNIAKNQEFELITSCHLKKSNLSKTHMEQSVEFNLFKKYKAIESLSILCPYF